MRMENNGRNSFTFSSRHIDIRHFFIKDWLDKGDLSIMYCPTHIMLADYLSTLLQGDLFYKFRYTIMGRVSPYTSLEDII